MWSIALGGSLLLPLAALAWAHSAPAEDAAILLRYIAHLAAGHGLVWNVGDAPVDGATDFGPTVVAALLVRVGLSPLAAVRWLGLSAHAFVLWSLYGAARRVGLPLATTLLVLLPIAWGPAWTYVNLAFVTTTFAAAALVVWNLANRWQLGERSRATRLGLPLAAVALGLVRPEGVFLSWIVVLIVAAQTPADRRALLGRTVTAFATVGAAYFLWRWSYFGHPLPTPYYKKGAFTAHWPSLISSVGMGLVFVWPYLGPLAASGRAGDKGSVGALATIVAFLGCWVLLSNETNHAGRFEYVVLPIAADATIRAWPVWRSRLTGAWGRAASAAFLLAATANAVAFMPRLSIDGRERVGIALSRIGTPAGQTMAVSEAGLLPYYSGWRAVDAWGLNDFDIATHGLTVARLARERPDLIQFHGALAADAPAPDGGLSDATIEAAPDQWERMLATLTDFARQEHYILAAQWTLGPRNTFTYLVRPDAPQRDAIIAATRESPYYAQRPPYVNVLEHPAEFLMDWVTRRDLRALAVNTVDQPFALR